jgi:hypothetical protein
MRAMNKFFAVAFAVLAAIACYGAVFCHATWHYGTAIACTIIATLLAADETPQKPGLSGK